MEDVITDRPRRCGAPLIQYDPAVADVICELLMESELGLYALLASRPDLPAWATVNRWMDQNAPFREAIMRARNMRLERMADGLCDLAGEARGLSTSHEVQAVKLEVDTRKWILSKLMSQVFGDKLDLTSKGEQLPAPSHQIDARVQSIVMQAAMRMQAATPAPCSVEAPRLLE